MADLAEVRGFLELNDEALETVLATEFAISVGIDIKGASDPTETQDRLKKAISALRERIAVAIGKSRDQLIEIACRQLRYCARRETAVEVLVVGLVDAYIIELSHIPLPMAGLCTYIIKTRMLDTICSCD